MRKPYQSPGSDEKLILLYCLGRGSNFRPPAHVASNMVKVSHALNHSATTTVNAGEKKKGVTQHAIHR